MTQKEFIVNTLLPYKLDRSTCAIDNNRNCVYLESNTGNKCAVGKHLVDGIWQNFSGDVASLHTRYNLTTILTDTAKAQNFPLTIWMTMQRYHDSIADADFTITMQAVKQLEKVLDINLSELYV